MKKTLPTISIPYAKPFAAILIINIIVVGLILAIRDMIPPQVPLFYGRPRGVEQLAPQLFLLLPPGVSILIAIVNSLFMIAIDDKFIKKVLIGIGCATTLLSTITVIKIILLVGAI